MYILQSAASEFVCAFVYSVYGYIFNAHNISIEVTSGAIALSKEEKRTSELLEKAPEPDSVLWRRR